MPSFFGLKFGGEKKKKAEPDAKPQWKKVDQNSLGEGQFFGKNLEARRAPNPSFAMPSRPGTAMSTRSKSPYALDTHDFAARSMFDLSQVSHKRQTSYSSLKPHNSEANLRTNFANGSSPNLALPPGIGGARPGTPTRPGTSHGQRSKPWVNPIDVLHGRKTPSGPRSPLALEAPQSAIGHSPLLGDNPDMVAQAIINQVNHSGQSSTTPPSAAPLSELGTKSPTEPYPSPPQSVKGMDRGPFNNRREAPNGVNGPAALPSPPMNTPLLEDEPSPWDGPPVIQNVAARKDSFIVGNGGTRRQSLSMKIEELEKTLVKEQEISRQANQAKFGHGPPQAAPGGRNMNGPPPQQGRVNEPRWPMDDIGPSAPDIHGRPRPQSPAHMRGPGPIKDGPRPHSPMGRGPRHQSPAGMRAPRNHSPMRHGPPRPHSPSGARGPRHQSPLGRGPRPASPMGRRPFEAPPRGQSPMGRPQRPHSPAGVRGPRPDSPAGRRPFDGPAGQGPPGMRPSRPEGPSGGHGPRPESPMGRRPFDAAPQRPGPGPLRPIGPGGAGAPLRSPSAYDQQPESPVVGRAPMNLPRSPPPGPSQSTNPFLRGPPQNRPPRPSHDEYGVRPKSRAGPPAAAVGARLGGNSLGRENSVPPRPVRSNTDDTFTFPFQKTPDSPPEQKTGFQFPFTEDAGTAPSRPQPLASGGKASPPASPPAIGGASEWPLPSPGKPPAARAMAPRDKDRPPQLNLAFQAGDYTQEIGDGPWTPPPVSPARLATAERPSTATGGPGGPGSFELGLSHVVLPPNGLGPIGVARGPSIRRDMGPGGGKDPSLTPEVQGQRRPDFGLVSPTGIADIHGTTFI